MIDALISGKLHGQPQQRTTKNGKPYATARIRATQGDGETLFVSVAAFDATPCRALLRLNDGDSVAIAGSLAIKIWDSKEGPRPSADLVAGQVLTLYETRKRRGAREES